jgi:hypothetical protein
MVALTDVWAKGSVEVYADISRLTDLPAEEQNEQ